jgi:hypothetical protein
VVVIGRQRGSTTHRASEGKLAMLRKRRGLLETL